MQNIQIVIAVKYFKRDPSSNELLQKMDARYEGTLHGS